jgi:hypothetical protein
MAYDDSQMIAFSRSAILVATSWAASGASAGDMPLLEQSTILQMIMATHCNGACK